MNLVSPVRSEWVLAFSQSPFPGKPHWDSACKWGGEAIFPADYCWWAPCFPTLLKMVLNLGVYSSMNNSHLDHWILCDSWHTQWNDFLPELLNDSFSMFPFPSSIRHDLFTNSLEFIEYIFALGLVKGIKCWDCHPNTSGRKGKLVGIAQKFNDPPKYFIDSFSYLSFVDCISRGCWRARPHQAFSVMASPSTCVPSMWMMGLIILLLILNWRWLCYHPTQRVTMLKFVVN